MCRCCKAASIISSPPAAANCSTAPDRAASTCSFSGGQIGGDGSINLVSIGAHDHPSVRFPGSFGSGYLYYVVPKVILFRLEHSRRTLVPKVDFISAPGTSQDNVYRTGGPVALVTNRCVFAFDKAKKRFRLESIHPGHTLDEVRDETGFEFDMPANVGETPAPDADTLRLMRERVAPESRRSLSGIHRAKFSTSVIRKSCHHILMRRSSRASRTTSWCAAAAVSSRTRRNPARPLRRSCARRMPREDRRGERGGALRPGRARGIDRGRHGRGVGSIARHPPMTGHAAAKARHAAPARTRRRARAACRRAVDGDRETARAAHDAAELVAVDYEELPAVTDVRGGEPGRAASLARRPAMSRSTGRAGRRCGRQCDARSSESFAEAAHGARVTRVNQRMGWPMEPRGATASFDRATSGYDLRVGSQGVGPLPIQLAAIMRWRGKLRVLTEDVGGAFGLKTPSIRNIRR